MTNSKTTQMIQTPQKTCHALVRLEVPGVGFCWQSYTLCNFSELDETFGRGRNEKAAKPPTATPPRRHVTRTLYSAGERIEILSNFKKGQKNCRLPLEAGEQRG